ncbi:hypothetical protein LUR55_00270 [Luteimonas sp. C4P040a]|nr:hypothetical protein [Luteimonas fraxinea]
MTQFRITYDGPALARHEMDARELAPALLAMADLLDASVKALHGDKAKAKINVVGSFKTGSFNVDFNTMVSLLKVARDMFAGDTATAVTQAAGILTLLGIMGKKGYNGLAQVLKWLRGRRITSVTLLENGRAVILVDADRLEVELQVLALLRDVAVREAFHEVLAPLERPGIDSFAAGSDVDFSVVIYDSERAYFSPPAGEDELILEDERKMAFSIVSLAFKDDNKWRLSDGNSTISAKITDADFLAEVNTSERSFSKGDVLVCRVKVTQWQSESGAKTDYEVIEVLEHRKGARQISIPGLDGRTER